MNTPFTLRVTPGGEPDSLAKALALLPSDDRPARILLSPGEYCEKIVVTRPNTVIEGADVKNTRLLWDDAANDILPDGRMRHTFGTATLRIAAERVTLKNLTVQNAAGPREKVGQAIALYVDGDGFLAENCRFEGMQDTLFTAPLPPTPLEPHGFDGPTEADPRRPQRQTYRNCTIVGEIDFIFGSAAAWFERCEILSRASGDQGIGYICAPSTPHGQRLGYVFSHCRFLSLGCAKESVYLARPWRDDAKAIFLSCGMDEHITEAGFDDWGKPAAHAACTFAEYACWGPGALGRRAAFAQTLRDEEANALTYDFFWAHALDSQTQTA